MRIVGISGGKLRLVITGGTGPEKSVTVYLVKITARPTCPVGLVANLQNFSGGVILVMFSVVTHRLPVSGLRQPRTKRIILGNLLRSFELTVSLSQVFTTSRQDQAIKSIILVS